MKSLVLWAASILILFAHPAWAMFEIRGNFGLLQAKPTDLNAATAAVVGNKDLELSDATLYGGDAILKIPGSHLGVGVRYENLNQKKTTSSYAVPGANGSGTLSVTNWAALLTFRPIDSMVYFGILGTYGLSDELHYKMGLDTGTLADYRADNCVAYSAGIEGGFRLGFIRLGAEAGYESISGTHLKDKGSSGTIADVKMAGPYGRISVGFGL